MRPDPTRAESLRAELCDLKLTQLRQRADAGGVSGQELDDATDSDEPKTALVTLLLGRAVLGEQDGSLAGEGQAGWRVAAVRAELAARGAGELRRRAAAAGASRAGGGVMLPFPSLQPLHVIPWRVIP
jgi:hypothetical protein